MGKVIVFGSLNMDLTIECDAMPQAGQTLQGRNFLTNPGGKGGNQAVAAAKLGAPTWMIARVGQDLFGEQVRLALEESGVDCTYVDRSDCNNTGVAVITRCGGDNRIILNAGANHEMCGKDVVAILDKLAEPKDIFVTQYECEQQAVIDALSAAKSHRLFTLFNPAPAKPIPADAYANISCQNALSRFKAMGVGDAIITLGEKGSVCRMGDDVILVDSYPVPNVDTTAAGDSYIGALACALVRGNNVEQCMRFATKVASLTITRQGAQQSIPYLNEVEAYFKEELK